MISEELSNIYGNKIRVRVCGVLTFEDKILMVNHSGLNSENIFWNFPGGGVETGESLKDALKREFKEETDIEITVENMLFLNQIIKKLSKYCQARRIDCSIWWQFLVFQEPVCFSIGNLANGAPYRVALP